MTKQVEFYYDYASPAAYLAWTQLPELCRQHGGDLVYRPVFLGGIFQITGNKTPVNIPAKKAWLFDDFARYAKFYDVPFLLNPQFIVNTLALMRGALWAQKAGNIKHYNRAMFDAMWVEGLPMEDADVVGKVLARHGFDSADLFSAIQTQEIKTQLIDATSEAATRGVFGVPSMFVGGEMHFGQDRLEWIRRALEHS